MFMLWLLLLGCSSAASQNLPAKCGDIWDPNEWLWFQGGKTKGVKLGAYTGLTPASKIHFIGCRGDAEGKKTGYVNTTDSAVDDRAIDIFETSDSSTSV